MDHLKNRRVSERDVGYRQVNCGKSSLIIAIDRAPIADLNNVDGENLSINTQNNPVVSHAIRVNGNPK